MLSINRIFILLLPLWFATFFETHGQTYADKDYYLIDSLDLQSISQRDVTLIDSILTIYHQCVHDTCRVKAIGVIVEDSWDEKVWPRYNQWIYDFIKPKIAEEENDKVRLRLLHSYAGALNNIGYLENSRGNIDSALVYYEKSLSIQKNINDQSALAGTYINIGFIYLNIGFIEKALDYYYSSLKLYEETQNQLGVSTALNAIGYIHYKQGESDKALDDYRQSLEIRESLGNDYGIATCLNNIGLVYRDRGELDLALDYYDRCLKLEESLGDKNGMAISYGNIGLVYNGLGKLDEALSYYENSFYLYKEMDNKSGISAALNDMASIMFLRGNIVKSREYAEESLQIAQQLDYPDKIRDAAKTLTGIDQKQSKWENAFNNLKLYHEMKDSVFNRETITSTINQRNKYKYEKISLADSLKNAEQQRISEIEKSKLVLKNEQQKRESYWLIFGLLMTIVFSGLIYGRLKVIKRQKRVIEKQKERVEIQKKENEGFTRDIEEQKKDLENLNLELTQFAQVVSHDLRAPLRGISGLVSMIEEDYPDIDSELQSKLRLIKERAVNSSQLIKGILTYTRAGQEEVPKEKIDVNELLQNVIAELDNYKNIEFKILSDCPVLFANKYQLEQIFLNLFDNAIKYNDRKIGEGLVEVSCSSQDTWCEFVVADNGPGIPEKMHHVVFELFRKGHDNQREDSTGIGLSVVKKLVLQNGGSIELISKDGEGAKFKFTWPMK